MKFPDLSDGICKEIGLEFFYPEEDVSVVPIAKKICSMCPVINECLDWGLRHENFGVWGGTVPRHRMQLRRKLGITFKSIDTRDYV